MPRFRWDKTMNKNRKILLRTAERIREHLVSSRAASPMHPLPEDSWNRCTRLARQFQLARTRGWYAAAAIVRDRYQSSFNRLVENLRELQNQFNYDEYRSACPSLRQIYEDLVAIDQEFESLRIDSEEGLLAVTTDRIVLEEIELGPFEIRLYWNRIGQKRWYDTVALKPNPASGDEDVTHPHVRGEALCEGDGRAAIERALCEGRLYDFFSIVNRILHTYSAGSPYVALNQWCGVSCADCGSMSDAEEATRCSNCSDNLCLDCRTYCERCECDFCQSCIGSCRVCDAALCRDCQISCAGCDKRCCSGCVSDLEICEECQNDQDPEFEDSTDETDIAASAATGATLEGNEASGATL